MVDVTVPEGLPLGLLLVGFDGTVRRYCAFKRDGGAPTDEVVGHSLDDILPREGQLARLRERIDDLVEGELGQTTSSLRLVFKDGHRNREIHAGLVSSPTGDEMLLTLSPVGHRDLPLSAQIRPNAIKGTLEDAAGLQIVAANTDFWRGIELMLAPLKRPERKASMIRLGIEWGLAHTVRVEGFVQRENAVTLREVELQVALEYLSGSLSVIGLGRFEVDLDHRQHGIVVIDHHNSPFPDLLTSGDDLSCHVLAGFHAGVFSYLSGRRLYARELFCTEGKDDSCCFIIGTEERLAELEDEEIDAVDAKLLAQVRTDRGLR